MFKRKQLRKASPGDFVVMGGAKIEDIIEGHQYGCSSFNKGNHGRYVSNHRLTKTGYPHNQLSPVDAGVLYYKSDSLFGKDIVEVIPLVFLGENYDSTAMNKYFEQGRPFYVNKKDIDIMPKIRMVDTVNEIGYNRLQNSFNILVDRRVLDSDSIRETIDDLIHDVRNR